MASTVSSSDAAEIASLDTVLFRLASIAAEDALQSVLSKLLPAILSKMRSDTTPAVKAKLLEIFSHINKRVKERTNIILPVAALVEQLKTADAAGSQFILMYVRMGFTRLPPHELHDLFPILWNANAYPAYSRDAVFVLGLQALRHTVLPHDLKVRLEKGDADVAVYSWAHDSAAQTAYSAFIWDVLCFLPPMEVENEGVKSVFLAPGLTVQAAARLLSASDVSPAGILKAAASFDYNTVQIRKKDVLRLLSANFLPDGAALPLALIASCDVNSDVCIAGEDLLKRYNFNADAENAELISALVRICLASRSRSEAGFTHGAFSVAARSKALNIMCRSKAALTDVPKALRIVSDALLNPAGNPWKYQQIVAKFLGSMIAILDKTALTPIAPIITQTLVTCIEKLVERVVSPPEDVTAADMLTSGAADAIGTLLSLLYSCLGSLATKCPTAVNRDTKIVKNLFRHLQLLPEDRKLPVVEALSQLSAAFSYSARAASSNTVAVEDSLLDLLSIYANQEDRRVRSAVLQWTVLALSFSNLRARLICAHYVDDPNLEIRHAAIRGLDPKSWGSLQGGAEGQVPTYPKFEDVVEFLEANPSWQGRALVQAAVLEFLDRCMQQQQTSGTSEVHLQSYIRMLDAALHCDPSIANISTLFEISAFQLARIIGRADCTLYRPAVSWLLQFLDEPKKQLRWAAAKLVANVAAEMPVKPEADRTETLLSSLDILSNWLQDADIRKLPRRQGAMQTASFLVENMQGRPSFTEARERIDKVILQIVDQITSGQKAAACAAIAAAGIIARAQALPIALGDVSQIPSFLKAVRSHSEIPLAAEPTRDKLHFIATLYKFSMGMLSTASTHEEESDSSWTEACAPCLGAIASGEVIATCRQGGNTTSIPPAALLATQALLALHVNSSEQTQFAVAGALLEIVSGRAPADAIDIPSVLSDPEKKLDIFYARHQDHKIESTEEHGLRDRLLDMVLDSILTGPLQSLTPHHRKSAAVWMLALVNGVRDDGFTSLTTRLPLLQAAFLQLLSDKNEFTQDCAARGLSLVYDVSSDTTRKLLMNSLLEAFDMGKKTAGPGQAPAAITLTSGGDSAYKELCSMANEVGQPDLIYKFLALAAHHANWHQRGAASIGLEALLNSTARDELGPLMKVLVPKLFRYQYDPVEKVRTSMTRLWQALVKDPAKAVADNIVAILEELISYTARDAWREREAACLALNDALHGRQAADVLSHMEQLWKAVLRAIDDVKDSVREAALMLLKTLSKLTLRLCDPLQTETSSSRAVVTTMLPFLLHEGVTSPLKDAQSVCLLLLRDITKLAGHLLRPHLSDLVYTALSSMSMFENSSLSVLQVHADAGTGQYGKDLDPQKLEYLRISATKNGPLAEILEFCLHQIREMPLVELDPVNALAGAAGDEEDEKTKKKTPTQDTILSTMVAKLKELIQSGIGLPARGAAARFVCNLCVTKPDCIKPHAMPLVRVFQASLNDTSITLRKEFATAAAYLSKYSKSGTLKKYVTACLELARAADDSQLRVTAGYAMKELCRLTPDRMKPLAPEVLPAVLMGAHDPHEQVRSEWEAVLEVLAESLPQSVRFYTKEILDKIAEGLDESSWVLKRQSASSLSAVVAILNTTSAFRTSSLPTECDIVLPVLSDVEAALKIVPETATPVSLAQAFERYLSKHATIIRPPQIVELYPYALSVTKKLIDSLGGRLWDGKEDVVSALGKFAAVVVDHLQSTDPTVVAEVVTALLAQLGKSSAQVAYHIAAASALASVLSACPGHTKAVHDNVVRHLRKLQRCAADSSDVSITAVDTAAAGTLMGKVDEAKQAEARQAAKRHDALEQRLASLCYMSLALSVPDAVNGSSLYALSAEHVAPVLKELKVELPVEAVMDAFPARDSASAYDTAGVNAVIAILNECLPKVGDWQEKVALFHSFAVLFAKVDPLYLVNEAKQFEASFATMSTLLQYEEKLPLVRISTLRALCVLMQRIRFYPLPDHPAFRSALNSAIVLRDVGDTRISSLASQIYGLMHG